MPPIRRRMLREFWYYFSRQNRGAVLGLFVFVLLVLIAVFAPVLAPHPPDEQYRDSRWRRRHGRRAAAQFLLGTDAVGRDILSRLIHGARYSLFIGIVVVTDRAGRRGRPSACWPAISAAGSMPSSCGSWMSSSPSPRCCWRWCWWRCWGRA
jgi:ABC-type microcin C transport system permease subunit YejE